MLFLLMFFGIGVRKFAIFDAQSIRRIADYVLVVVTPCLSVTSFQRPFDRSALVGVCWSFAADPVGASVTVFAARYGIDADYPTALVALSTLLSVVTMPIVVSATMYLF